MDRLWHYALRETGIVEIESEWTARDREQETGAAPGEYFSAQVSAQNQGANLGHLYNGRSLDSALQSSATLYCLACEQ